MGMSLFGLRAEGTCDGFGITICVTDFFIHTLGKSVCVCVTFCLPGEPGISIVLSHPNTQNTSETETK